MPERAGVIWSELRASAWKYAAIACAIVAFGALTTTCLQSYRLAVAQKALAIVAKNYAQAESRAERIARREEHSRAEAVNHITAAYQKGIRDGQAAADDLRADVDSGRFVLRDRFRCPATQRAAGQVAASPRAGDGEARAVLSRSDQEFLIRIGAEADEVTRQLSACQAIVKADREPVK